MSLMEDRMELLNKRADWKLFLHYCVTFVQYEEATDKIVLFV